MVATKKILVIVLMVALASSVAAGSLFTGKPSTRLQEPDINTQLNSVVEFCTRSLPAGTSECDYYLRELVDNTCKNDNTLDACRNDKVTQYYSTRTVHVSNDNTTS